MNRLYRVSQRKWNGGFSVPCELKLSYFFSSLDKTSSAEDNDTKIIKFDWGISRNGHKIKITQPNLMILVYIILLCGICFMKWWKHSTFSSQGILKIRRSAISGTPGIFNCSVASFLVWGGGGGARPPNVPTKIIYVLILRERAPQKHIFSGLKIHLHTMSYTINSVSFNYVWYGAIYTTLYWQDTKHKRNLWIC